MRAGNEAREREGRVCEAAKEGCRRGEGELRDAARRTGCKEAESAPIVGRKGRQQRGGVRDRHGRPREAGGRASAGLIMYSYEDLVYFPPRRRCAPRSPGGRREVTGGDGR